MENKKSRLLVQYLRKNAREKLTTISKETGIPISTLFDLLKEMEGNIILRNTILIDFYRLGYHTQAHVFLKALRENKEEIRKHLLFHPNVNNIYKTHNEWSFIIETVHHNIKELDNFLEKLETDFKIEKHQVHYLIEEIKKEGFEIQ